MTLETSAASWWRRARESAASSSATCSRCTLSPSGVSAGGISRTHGCGGGGSGSASRAVRYEGGGERVEWALRAAHRPSETQSCSEISPWIFFFFSPLASSR